MNLFACSEFGRVYEIFESGESNLLLDSGYGNIYTCIHMYKNTIFIGSANKELIIIKKDGDKVWYKKIVFPFESFKIEFITNIEDLIFLCSSNNDLILVIPFDDILSKVESGKESNCCMISFMSYRLLLNGIQSTKDTYLVSTKKYETSYNNDQKESGLLILDHKFNLIKKEKYGWEVAGLLVDGNDDVFCVCNSIYKDDYMSTCLVCNNELVMVFSEGYFLSSVVCDHDDIYISGRVISEFGDTTENKGFILKTKKNEYKVDYVYYFTNSGLITGCCCESNEKPYVVDVSYLRDLCYKKAIVTIKEEETRVVYGKV